MSGLLEGKMDRDKMGRNTIKNDIRILRNCLEWMVMGQI